MLQVGVKFVFITSGIVPSSLGLCHLELILPGAVGSLPFLRNPTEYILAEVGIGVDLGELSFVQRKSCE